MGDMQTEPVVNAPEDSQMTQQPPGESLAVGGAPVEAESYVLDAPGRPYDRPLLPLPGCIATEQAYKQLLPSVDEHWTDTLNRLLEEVPAYVIIDKSDLRLHLTPAAREEQDKAIEALLNMEKAGNFDKRNANILNLKNAVYCMTKNRQLLMSLLEKAKAERETCQTVVAPPPLSVVVDADTSTNALYDKLIAENSTNLEKLKGMEELEKNQIVLKTLNSELNSALVDTLKELGLFAAEQESLESVRTASQAIIQPSADLQVSIDNLKTQHDIGIAERDSRIATLQRNLDSTRERLKLTSQNQVDQIRVLAKMLGVVDDLEDDIDTDEQKDHKIDTIFGGIQEILNDTVLPKLKEYISLQETVKNVCLNGAVKLETRNHFDQAYVDGAESSETAEQQMEFIDIVIDHAIKRIDSLQKLYKREKDAPFETLRKFQELLESTEFELFVPASGELDALLQILSTLNETRLDALLCFENVIDDIFFNDELQNTHNDIGSFLEEWLNTPDSIEMRVVIDNVNTLLNSVENFGKIAKTLSSHMSTLKDLFQVDPVEIMPKLIESMRATCQEEKASAKKRKGDPPRQPKADIYFNAPERAKKARTISTKPDTSPKPQKGGKSKSTTKRSNPTPAKLAETDSDMDYSKARGNGDRVETTESDDSDSE